MKIFNWVHRKFHHTDLKDEEFGRDDMKKKAMSQELTMESQTLLVDGSILSIGTFGLPFHDQPSSNKETEPKSPEGEDEGFDSDDDDDDDRDNNESEANPLVLTTFKHNLDMTSPNNMTSFDGICSSEITDYSSDNSDYKKIIGERTTLADLFLADSQIKLNLNSVQELVLNKKRIQQHADWVATKSSLSFPKKLIPQVGGKPRPIKKLNQGHYLNLANGLKVNYILAQLMRRMMRRKIHPELGQRKAPAHDKNIEAQELESIDESAYLLPTPEVVG